MTHVSRTGRGAIASADPDPALEAPVTRPARPARDVATEADLIAVAGAVRRVVAARAAAGGRTPRTSRTWSRRHWPGCGRRAGGWNAARCSGTGWWWPATW